MAVARNCAYLRGIGRTGKNVARDFAVAVAVFAGVKHPIEVLVLTVVAGLGPLGVGEQSAALFGAVNRVGLPVVDLFGKHKGKGHVDLVSGGEVLKGSHAHEVRTVARSVELGLNVGAGAGRAGGSAGI